MLDKNSEPAPAPICSLLACGIPLVFWAGTIAAKNAGSNGAGGFAAGMGVMLLFVIICSLLALILTVAAFIRRERLAFIPVIFLILALLAWPK